MYLTDLEIEGNVNRVGTEHKRRLHVYDAFLEEVVSTAKQVPDL